MAADHQGTGFQPLRRAAVTFNGITVAYLMGIVNALLATLVAFNVDLNDVQVASLAGLVNAALIASVHVSHRLGEVVASGADTRHSRDQVAKLVDPSHAPSEIEGTVFPGEVQNGN